MRCKFCNAEISEEAKFCPMCGVAIRRDETDGQVDPYTQYGQSMSQNVQKPINGTLYIILSVLSLLMCCLPLGIASIIFSSRINSQQKNGDYAGARESARTAKILLIISLAAGIVTSVALIGFAFSDLGSDFGDDFAKDVISSDIDGTDDDNDDVSGGEDGMEGDLDYITEGDIKPAKPVSELGDTWNTYTVQINDHVITFPCEYKEFEKAGLTIDQEMWLPDEDGMVSGRGYILGYLKDEEGDVILADFINPDEKSKKAEECLIGGITAYDYDLKGSMEIIFPGNIQMGAAKEDVLEKYGESEDVYEGEEYHMYTWYEDESYYSNVLVSFNSKNEKVSELSMKNYGE